MNHHLRQGKLNYGDIHAETTMCFFYYYYYYSCLDK